MRYLKRLWNKIFIYPVSCSIGFSVANLTREIDSLREQCQKLAQDQYAKAHMDECMRLEDRITTAFKAWDETITAMHERIEKLENPPRKIKQGSNK
jgi:FtsZ-binding cell division protein ZapB